MSFLVNNIEDLVQHSLKKDSQFGYCFVTETPHVIVAIYCNIGTKTWEFEEKNPNQLIIKDYILITDGHDSESMKSSLKKLSSAINENVSKIVGYTRIIPILYSKMVEKLKSDPVSSTNLAQYTLDILQAEFNARYTVTHIASKQFPKEYLFTKDIDLGNERSFKDFGMNLKKTESIDIDPDMLKVFKSDIDSYNRRVNYLLSLIDRLNQTSCKGCDCMQIERYLINKDTFEAVRSTMRNMSDVNEHMSDIIESYEYMHEIKDLWKSLPEQYKARFEMILPKMDASKPLFLVVQSAIQFLSTMAIFIAKYDAVNIQDVSNTVKCMIKTDYELECELLSSFAVQKFDPRIEITRTQKELEDSTDSKYIEKELFRVHEEKLIEEAKELNASKHRDALKSRDIFSEQINSASNLYKEFEEEKKALMDSFHLQFTNLVSKYQKRSVELSSAIQTEKTNYYSNSNILARSNAVEYEQQKKKHIEEYKSQVQEKRNDKVKHFKENLHKNLTSSRSKEGKGQRELTRIKEVLPSLKLNRTFLETILTGVPEDKRVKFYEEVEEKARSNWSIRLKQYEDHVKESIENYKQLIESLEKMNVASASIDISDPEFPDFEPHLEANQEVKNRYEIAEKEKDRLKKLLDNPVLEIEVVYK
jgi:hypothetical protein